MRRGCGAFVLLLILLAAVGLLFWKPILTGLGNALVEDDGVQKAEAAVVLGGDAAGVRILKAAELAQAGYVPVVIVDGPKSLMGYESDTTIKYAEQKGYPAALFQPLPMPPNVNSTGTEAVFVGKYLKSHGIRNILLVTSDYHTHRAAFLFRHLNSGLKLAVIPAPDPNFPLNLWWDSYAGRRTFFLEWTKTIAEYIGL